MGVERIIKRVSPAALQAFKTVIIEMLVQQDYRLLLQKQELKYQVVMGA